MWTVCPSLVAQLRTRGDIDSKTSILGFLSNWRYKALNLCDHLASSHLGLRLAASKTQFTNSLTVSGGGARPSVGADRVYDTSMQFLEALRVGSCLVRGMATVGPDLGAMKATAGFSLTTVEYLSGLLS